MILKSASDSDNRGVTAGLYNSHTAAWRRMRATAPRKAIPSEVLNEIPSSPAAAAAWGAGAAGFFLNSRVKGAMVFPFPVRCWLISEGTMEHFSGQNNVIISPKNVVFPAEGN